MKLLVKKRSAEKMRKGYPLIEKEAVVNREALQKEGELFRVVDEKGNFLGQAYYGIQNKGVGWIISHNQNEKINQAFFEGKLKAAFNHRKPLFADEDTTAFRVFNGEGDGIGGMTIDYYDGHYVIQWYSKGIYAFRDLVLPALQQTADCKAIYQKKRFDDKGQYVEDNDFVRPYYCKWFFDN